MNKMHPNGATIETFERHESAVRSYCRSFPAIFRSARNAEITDVAGRTYIDFLAGCATLNYGHNDPDMKQALLDYVMSDGIVHGLDMYTEAKEAFLRTFHEVILRPRDLDYRMMFQGPTGANAVEAAIKLARKKTGRENVIAFTNGYHGVTVGALAATGNGSQRKASRAHLSGVSRAPYEGFHGADIDSAQMLDDMLSDTSSGMDAPAAIILECIQGEGGLNVASKPFLQKLATIAKRHGALLIVDDIQAGCGRSGDFFAFEFAGIQPDIVTMAKSLSGFGLPFSMILIKPEHDVYGPAEHNGTFRGNNHAFLTARVALEKFWRESAFSQEVQGKSQYLLDRLNEIAAEHGSAYRVKGRGMMRGIDTGSGELASTICREAFARGLIIETSGSSDEIVKVLAPLTIEDSTFARGLDILADAFRAAVGLASHSVAAE